MNIFYWLFFNLGLSTVHINFGNFLLNKFRQKRGKFPLLIAFLLAPSRCGVNRAWFNVTSEKERLYIVGPREGKEIVNRCVVAGCSNTPSDGVLRRIWEKQIQRTLAQWKATKHSPFFVATILLRTCFEGGATMAV